MIRDDPRKSATRRRSATHIWVLFAIVAAAATLTTVASVRPIAIAIAIAAAGMLAYFASRLVQQAAREQKERDELRRLNAGLTERIEAGQNDLRHSAARLRSIIESAVDAIIVIDERGRVESFNPAAERLFGYTESDMIGGNVSTLMPSPYQEEHDGYLNRYLETGHAKIIGIGREVTARRRDGTTFKVHLSVGEFRVGGERRFTGILHDLSKRAAVEEQLREQTALARIGEMAAVIAHEVKNPLAGVRGAIDVMRGRLPAGSSDAPILSEIVARIDGLNALVKDLLLFARPPQPRHSPIEIGRLVALTAELLRRDPLFQGMTVDVSGSAPTILADAEMLKIVFQNLLVNAAQAMQGRGRVAVTLRTSDDSCIVSFADHGPGIPADVRDQVFTAFFTTKARGSGLGLATAKRLVDAHHGSIRVECPDEGGTVVTVQLPLKPD